jgi:hypothetical protein
MEVVPQSVGAASRSWDEQHLDLSAAAEQIGAAPTGGFTTGVSGAATRFATTWQRHTTSLGDTAEARADGLRAAIADYLNTDRVVATDWLFLGSYLEEER